MLEGIDLEVARGELVSLLGPSGCGKSTLLRMVAGFIKPDAGRIEIGGRDVTRVPTHRRNVGIVHQSHALVAAPDRRRERGVRARDAQGEACRARAQGERDAGGGRARRIRTPPARTAVGWSAATRRPRQGAGDRATGAAARRAALQPRRQPARAPARGDPPHPAATSPSRRSSSPTTARRRWRSPTGSCCCTAGTSPSRDRRRRCTANPTRASSWRSPGRW